MRFGRVFNGVTDFILLMSLNMIVGLNLRHVIDVGWFFPMFTLMDVPVSIAWIAFGPGGIHWREKEQP